MNVTKRDQESQEGSLPHKMASFTLKSCLNSTYSSTKRLSFYLRLCRMHALRRIRRHLILEAWCTLCKIIGILAWYRIQTISFFYHTFLIIWTTSSSSSSCSCCDESNKCTSINAWSINWLATIKLKERGKERKW